MSWKHGASATAGTRRPASPRLPLTGTLTLPARIGERLGCATLLPWVSLTSTRIARPGRSPPLHCKVVKGGHFGTSGPPDRGKLDTVEGVGAVPSGSALGPARASTRVATASSSPRGPVPRAGAEAPPLSPFPASGPAAIGSCRRSPETVSPGRLWSRRPQSRGHARATTPRDRQGEPGFGEPETGVHLEDSGG